MNTPSAFGVGLCVEIRHGIRGTEGGSGAGKDSISFHVNMSLSRMQPAMRKSYMKMDTRNRLGLLIWCIL